MNQGGSQSLWRVLGLLERVKPSGSGWAARCPAHEDREPSLSVGLGLDGRVLLNCMVGCEPAAVCAALNLTLADLFERPREGVVRRRFRLVNSQGETVAEHVRDDAGGKKSMWFESGGKRSLNGHRKADLPLYGLPELLKAEPGSRVYFCEGETATQSLLDRGILAVGSATGASDCPSPDVLRVLAGYSVALWPDNDQAGLEHMQRIQKALESLSVRCSWVLWPDAPEKGDAADFVGDATAVAALVVERLPVATATRSLEIISAADLLKKEFKAPRWAVPEVLPEGLTILGGRPKMGKSWLGLDLSIEIARGGQALRKTRCERGDVLYLALEDGQRRIQERLQLVLGDSPAPPRLFVAGEWPKLGDGGQELLSDWLAEHPQARAVFIDTFKRIRGEEDSRKRLYDLDYDALAPLQALALQHGVAIVVVFHTRKGDSDDPLELISGTLGLTGVADAVMVLRRERGQADAALFVTGRDVEERDLALKFHGQNSDRFGWEWLGNAEDYRLSKERQAILDTLQAIPGVRPSEIADAIGKTAGSVRYLLFRMVRDAEVRVREGLYYPAVPLAPTSTIANSPIATPGQGVSTLKRTANANTISPGRDVSTNSTHSLVRDIRAHGEEEAHGDQTGTAAAVESGAPEALARESPGTSASEEHERENTDATAGALPRRSGKEPSTVEGTGSALGGRPPATGDRRCEDCGSAELERHQRKCQPCFDRWVMKEDRENPF